jgi:ParB-like chromosome segregation protein Spo0J
MREFGFTNPALIDETGVLIAGHGRLVAAKELGLSEVPTITLAGLSETQKKALRLADNKIALNAGWDLEVLRLELAEIGTLDVDFDVSLTGFASGEIDVMLRLRLPRTRSAVADVDHRPRLGRPSSGRTAGRGW